MDSSYQFTDRIHIGMRMREKEKPLIRAGNGVNPKNMGIRLFFVGNTIKCKDE